VSKDLIKIGDCVKSKVEPELNKNLLVMVSAQKVDHAGKGLNNGADILVLTGHTSRYFDPINNKWIGDNDDSVFNFALPPVVIICQKYNAKETGIC
jgi:hypothetical protein